MSDSDPQTDLDGATPLVDGPPPSLLRKHLNRRTLTLAAAILVGGTSVLAAGWYGATRWLGLGAEEVVPLIQADSRPYKVRPDDPGGLQIPNRDKLVYDRLTGEERPAPVERLLPAPERPLPPPRPGDQPRELASDAPPPPPPPVTPRVITESPPPPPSEDTAVAAATPEPKPVPEAAKPPSAEPPSATPASATPVVPVVKAAADGDFLVQLASVRAEEGAHREWARLSKRHGDLLGTLALSVERADLGARGVYYRVRAGPLADRAAATCLCDALKARKLGCLVVRR